MRKSFLALLMSAALWGQDEAVFRSSTRLVQVGVIAEDKNGQSVTGLTAADFRLKDAGKRQEIRLFAVNQANGGAMTVPSAGAKTFSNRGVEQRGRGSVTVFVMDYLNTPWNQQAFATRELIKYLRSVKPEEHMAIYTISNSGLRMLHDYTTDATSLLAALKESRGEIVDLDRRPANYDPGSELSTVLTPVGQLTRTQQRELEASEGDQYQEREPTLNAFERLARILDAIPVRKNVIWISGGFSAQEWGNGGQTVMSGKAAPLMQAPIWAGHDNGVRVTDSMEGMESYRSEIDHTMRLLNEANVALYPIEARGLRARVPGETSKIANAMVDADEQNMVSLAKATGGRAFISDNDLQGAMRTVLDAPMVTYTLGFYADTAQARDTFHKIEVTLVDHPGVTLRYRKGYDDGPEREADGGMRRRKLDQAGLSPIDSSAIAITGTVEGGAGVSLRIGVDGLGLHETGDRKEGTLDILLVQRDEQGNEYQRVNDTLSMALKPATYDRLVKTGIPYQHALAIDAKAGYVRVVVRDLGTGNIGSLTIPLQGR